MDPSTQSVSLAAFGPTRTSRNRYSQAGPRASRIANHPDRPDMVDRISRLLPISKRIMGHYAGKKVDGRLRTLEKLEEHQRVHNEDPIAQREAQWKCLISGCDHEPFTTFQKAAIHLTSKEWKLSSWPCVAASWYGSFFVGYL
jgi:hypothetical protein